MRRAAATTATSSAGRPTRGSRVRGGLASAAALAVFATLTLWFSAAAPALSDAGIVSPVSLQGSGDPIVAAAGDIACDPAVTSPSRCDSAKTAKLVLGMNPSAVLAVGDLQYPTGTLADFMQSYDKTWGKFRSITYPVIGDNEYLSSSKATGYWDYWNGPGNETGPGGTRGQGYYSFDVGAWHVVAVNSEINTRDGSPQADWLRADLAAHPADCILAFWHSPLFSSDRGHQTPKMRPIVELLYEAGAELVVNGHHHTYERFGPQDPQGHADPNGIRQITAGTGGKSVTGNDGSAPNSQRSAESFGVLRLTLHPASYEWQFVSTGSKVLDSGSTACTTRSGSGGPDVPTVYSVTPGVGQQASTQEETVTGTGFANPATADFGPGVTVRSVDVTSPTTLEATISIAPDAAAGSRDVTVSRPGGPPSVCAGCFSVRAPGGPTSPSPATQPTARGGYRLVASDGGIFAFGDAPFLGSTGSIKLARPIVGMTATPSGKGYWLVASDGGVFAFGDAAFLGSTGALKLARPIVGMTATPSGKGYWLVASDGGVFAFGDAAFLGSTGSIKLSRPIVGMTATPSGKGYWLVASDGGVFAFGDARFLGSTGALKLARPIVGMTATPSGKGYRLVASDGGIFSFGDAVFHGSTGSLRLTRPIVAMASTASGLGYWLVASDGGVFAFGDAPFLGSTGPIRLAQPIVGMASQPVR